MKIRLYLFGTLSLAAIAGIIVARWYANRSLDREIGQLLMVGFRGYDINSESTIVKDIRERHLGGVILFDYDKALKAQQRNIKSPDQLRRLTQSLQENADGCLLIGLDYEGGKVARLKESLGFPATATAWKMASLADGAFDSLSETMAKTLATGGINLNFAPVVDLNSNPKNPAIAVVERSFSSDPSVVVNKATRFIQKHHDQGVLTTLKHFPGLGSASSDTHDDIVDISATWSEADLIPFRELIRTGQADVIMVAHVFRKEWDPQYPATLSPTTIVNKLRRELKFDGVVVSDDLQMDAIVKHYDLQEAIRLAIQADIDILLVNNNQIYDENIVQEITATIKQLVTSNQISRVRIAKSCERILNLKKKLQTHCRIHGIP